MQTPGRPRAIVVAAAILLAATMALAATAVWARDLGAPVHLDGWALTFRPPKGWTSEGPQEDGYGATVTYSEPGDQGAGRELRLSRRNNPKGLPAEQLCRTLVQGLFARQVGPLRSLFHRPAVSYERRPLGPLPGVRGLVVEPVAVCLHVGTCTRQDGTREAYVLELHLTQGLTQADLSLCDALARTIRSAD